MGHFLQSEIYIYREIQYERIYRILTKSEYIMTINAPTKNIVEHESNVQLNDFRIFYNEDGNLINRLGESRTLYTNDVIYDIYGTIKQYVEFFDVCIVVDDNFNFNLINDVTLRKAKLPEKNIQNKREKKDTKLIMKDYELYGRIYTLPYLFFDKQEINENENCVIQTLIKMYGPNSKTKQTRQIAVKSINKFFELNTSIEQLKLFCDKYNIGISAYDIFKQKIIEQKGNHERAHLICMIFNNHIYLYSGNNKSKHDFTIKEGCDIPGFYTTYKEHNKSILKEYIEKKDDIMNNATTKLYDKLTQNFMYESELELVIKSLYFTKQEYAHERTKINDDGNCPCGCKIKCLDMKKAFYTCLLNSPNYDIPIFTVQDVITKFNINNNINETSYYILDMVPRYYQNNILTGYEVINLLKHNLISIENIMYEKGCTKSFKKNKFIEVLNEIYSEAIKEDPTIIKEEFMIYNGILGIRRNKIHKISLLIDNVDDMDLLDINQTPHYKLNFSKELYEYYKVLDMENDSKQLPDNGENIYVYYKTYGKKEEYLYFNNRNLYNHIIAMTNIAMINKIIDIKNNGCKILKVNTDDICYIGDYKNIDDTFRYKSIFISEYYRRKEIIDGDIILSETIKEIESFKNKIQIITGKPGAGKTYKIKKEELYEIAMTTTNICCRNMDTIKIKANTIYHSLNMFHISELHKSCRKYKNKIIWIDEFSMCNSLVWSCLFILSQHAKQLIITGDINQIPPINDELNYSNIFFKITMSDMIELRTNYRNDNDIISLCDYVLTSTPRDTINYIKQTQSIISDDNEICKYNYHITLTNAMRHNINNLILHDRKLTCKIEYTEDKQIKYNISKGVILIVRRSYKKKGLYKGDRYINVDDCEGSHLFNQVHLLSLRTNEYIFISAHDLEQFEIGYACTAHSSQGLTIEEPFVIHEVVKILGIDNRILYTAISRGREMNNIHFVLDNKINNDIPKQGNMILIENDYVGFALEE